MSENEQTQNLKIQVNENLYFEVKNVEFVGDLYDASNNKLGTGNYIVKLENNEIPQLQIGNTTNIARKLDN